MSSNFICATLLSCGPAFFLSAFSAESPVSFLIVVKNHFALRVTSVSCCVRTGIQITHRSRKKKVIRAPFKLAWLNRQLLMVDLSLFSHIPWIFKLKIDWFFKSFNFFLLSIVKDCLYTNTCLFYFILAYL